VRMEAAWSFEMLVLYHITEQHHDPEDQNLCTILLLCEGLDFSYLDISIVSHVHKETKVLKYGCTVLYTQTKDGMLFLTSCSLLL
jgi:hypothetical protein